MKLEQIAILLELIGFVLASLTVALIKIQYIKHLLDKIKSNIIMISDKIVRDKPDFDKASVDSSIRMTQFYKDLINLIINLPGIWYKIIKSFTTLTLRVRFKEIRRLLIHHKPTYIFTLSLPLILVLIIPWTVLWIITVLLLKLNFVLFSKIASAEFFTTSTIVIGTLIALAGLVIELVLALQT